MGDDDRETAAAPAPTIEEAAQEESEEEEEKEEAATKALVQKESEEEEEKEVAATRGLVQALRERLPLFVIRRLVEGEPPYFRPPSRHAPNLFLSRKNPESGTTPLHEALMGACQLCVITYLVKTSRESVRVMTGTGDLPLHVAADPAVVLHSKAVRALVNAYPDALMERNSEGWLPLHLALAKDQASRRGPLDLGTVKRMVRLGPQALRVPGPDGRLPIHCLVECGARAPLKTVRLLADAHPEALLVRDAGGKTPLHAAAGGRPLVWAGKEGGALAVVRCLAEAFPDALGVPVNDGRLPLHAALSWDDTNEAAEAMGASELDEVTAIVRFLVERHPEALRVADRDGNLPLRVAARSGVPTDLLSLLLTSEHQGQVGLRAKNSEGWLPVHLALRFDRPDGGGATPDDFEKMQAVFLCVKPWPACLKERGPDGRTLVHGALVPAVTNPHRAMWQLAVLSSLPDCPEAAIVPDVDGSLPLHRAAVDDDLSLTLLYMIVRAQPGDVLRRRSAEGGVVSEATSRSSSSLTGRSGPPSPKRARTGGDPR